MPQARSTSTRSSPTHPAACRTAPPGSLPRTRLLLQMQVHWQLRAHLGYLQAAGFRWPRPAHEA